MTLQDANDNNPKFTEASYSFSVLDTAEAGSEVGQVQATDDDAGDNGQVTYSLMGSTGPFTMSSAGKLTVAQNLSLVKELASSYSLTALAQDNGTPSR